MTYDELLEIAPYSLDKEQKKMLLTKRLVELTKHHRSNCKEYDQMLTSIGFDEDEVRQALQTGKIYKGYIWRYAED